MSQLITAPRGTHDIPPGSVALWQLVERVGAATLARAGFQEIRTPVFEATDLFARGIGADTDIVGKEMYSFRDRSDRFLTLRPEGTAGVVRAYLEHKLYATGPGPARLWYQGPMFRYERPQKGRQRQFYQIGVEVFGAGEPAADAEAVVVAHDFYRDVHAAFGALVRDRLGAETAGRMDGPELRVEMNSLGDAQCRPAYRDTLQAYFGRRAAEYCADCRRRTQTNPLRVLDCKVPQCQELNRAAPPMALCEPCADHFRRVMALLEVAGIPAVHNPRIVRGLDYYTRTVFELVAADAREAGQTTLCAGGRYDGLVAELGGPDTPAVGWALGEERAIEWLCERAGRLTPADLAALGAPEADVFVAAMAAEAVTPAFNLAVALRRAGLRAQAAYGPGRPDKHLKSAVRLGARHLALLGPDELAAGTVAIRDLATRQQTSRPLDATQIARDLRQASAPAARLPR